METQQLEYHDKKIICTKCIKRDFSTSNHTSSNHKLYYLHLPKSLLTAYFTKSYNHFSDTFTNTESGKKKKGYTSFGIIFPFRLLKYSVPQKVSGWDREQTACEPLAGWVYLQKLDRFNGFYICCQDVVQELEVREWLKWESSSL